MVKTTRKIWNKVQTAMRSACSGVFIPQKDTRQNTKVDQCIIEATHRAVKEYRGVLEKLAKYDME